MMYRLLLVAASCLAASPSHHELRGEHPDKADIDDGQCIPMKCDMGVPPRQCTELCTQRHFLSVCQPPGDFCLCQRLRGGLGGTLELISPDEVLEQPLDHESDYGPLNVFTFIIPLGRIFQETRSIPNRHHVDKPEVDDLPDPDSVPDPEPFLVNVHEGRLFWLFHYVLTGLFLLMVALVLYELLVCATHNTHKYEEFDHDHDPDYQQPIKWKTFNPV